MEGARTRPGGTIGYVGVPHGVAGKGLNIMNLFFANLTWRGGPAPVRAYMPALMDDVLAGTLDPSPVFDMTVDLANLTVPSTVASDAKVRETPAAGSTEVELPSPPGNASLWIFTRSDGDWDGVVRVF